MENKIQLINKIASEAQAFWKSSNKDTEKFPEYAANLLKQIDYSDFYDEEILTKILDLRLGRQYYRTSDFSNLPICIAFAEDVFVDLYFWTESDTNIHNHGFVGAFAVLKGEIFQTQFSFDNSETIVPGLCIGDCNPVTQDKLNVGHIQPILFGDKFIHQSLHVQSKSETTVTICIRTLPLPELNLSSFLLPHIKFETRHCDDETLKKLEILNFLYSKNPADHRNLVKKTFMEIPLLVRLNFMSYRWPREANIHPEFPLILQEQLSEEFHDQAWFKKLVVSVSYHNKVLNKLSLLKT